MPKIVYLQARPGRQAGTFAIATGGADTVNTSKAVASSSRVFFTVKSPRRKNLGLHRENGAQKGGVHTKRTFVLILRNVTKHSLYVVDAEWDSSGGVASAEFPEIEKQTDSPKESNKQGSCRK